MNPKADRLFNPKRMFLNSLITTLLVLVSGCSDPVKEYLDAKFPPVNRQEQQDRAVESLSETLVHLEMPALSVGLEIAEIERIISQDGGLDPSIKSVKLTGDDQLLMARVDMEKTFSQKDWSEQADIDRLLKNSEISIGAEIDFTMTLEASIREGEEGPKFLKMTLLPAFESIDIKSISVENGEFESEAVEPLGEAIEYLINRYSENVSGYLAGLEIMETTLPVEVLESNNPSGLLTSKQGEDLDLKVTLASEDIHTPIEVGGLAVLIDKQHVKALVEFIPTDADYTPAPGTESSGYDEARQVFDALHEAAFGQTTLEKRAWVGLSKNILAISANSVVNQAQACFKAETVIPEETFSETISPPDWESIDCSSDRDCRQTRDCTFVARRDTRNCNVCLLRAPKICPPWGGGCSGGQCIQRGNDPICEAAKAAQNVIYEAERAARQLDCERIKEQNRIACEVEKTVERTACEAGRAVLEQIARTGNIANVKGAINGRAEANVCFEQIAVSDDLSKINLDLGVSGGAKIGGRLEIIPLDILGHLVCQMPASTNLDFDVSIPAHHQSLNMDLAFEEIDGEFGLAFTTSALTIPVRLNPTPTEWLLSNVDMTFKCSGLNLIRPLVAAANPFVPELRGITEFEQASTSNFMKLELPTQTIAEEAVTPIAQVNEKSIFLVVE